MFAATKIERVTGATTFLQAVAMLTRDVPVFGQAQSSEGTDESSAVVMVRDGIETLVQLSLRSQGLD